MPHFHGKFEKMLTKNLVESCVFSLSVQQSPFTYVFDKCMTSQADEKIGWYLPSNAHLFNLPTWIFEHCKRQLIAKKKLSSDELKTYSWKKFAFERNCLKSWNERILQKNIEKYNYLNRLFSQFHLFILFISFRLQHTS